MVGHTGSLQAAIKAVEAVDMGLGHIADAIRKAGGILLVTADHGNCEMMYDPGANGPHTSHTTNPVPLILMGAGDISLAEGRLADVAPTLLELMELPKPAEMTGDLLLRPPQVGRTPAAFRSADHAAARLLRTESRRRRFCPDASIRTLVAHLAR